MLHSEKTGVELRIYLPITNISLKRLLFHVPKMAIAERFDFTGILMHVLFSFVIDDSGGSFWQDWVF